MLNGVLQVLSLLDAVEEDLVAGVGQGAVDAQVKALAIANINFDKVVGPGNNLGSVALGCENLKLLAQVLLHLCFDSIHVTLDLFVRGLDVAQAATSWLFPRHKHLLGVSCLGVLSADQTEIK